MRVLNAVLVVAQMWCREGESAANLLNLRPTDELASHGHLVRTWNTVASGGFPQLYRDGKWERYTQGAFKVSGEWNNNAGTTANSPQGGLGDPAGTTDGTGGNAPHNNIQPSIAAYCWKRTA
jgi:hypothetical protein